MLLSIYVSLTITFGPPITATLDVNPTFIVEAPVERVLGGLGTRVHAVTLPHLILIDPYVNTDYSYDERRLLINEEIIHSQQWSALGPWFPVSYAATLGRAFEPYDPLNMEGYSIVRDQDPSRMWIPSPELVQRCPLLRIGSERGFQLLPCWFN